MSMTSKERMLRALTREKPDRLPVTVHQWQQYHLDNYLGGVDALEAFKICGLDASVQYFEAMGQFWIQRGDNPSFTRPSGVRTSRSCKLRPGRQAAGPHHLHSRRPTHVQTGGNRMTTWITEYLIKKKEDLELVETYMPVASWISGPSRRSTTAWATAGSCGDSCGATRRAAGSTRAA